MDKREFTYNELVIFVKGQEQDMSEVELVNRLMNVDPTIEEFVLSSMNPNQIVQFTGATDYNIINEIDISDWFDIENMEHIKAYRHLQETGFWPKDFIPKYVIFSSVWNQILANKMARVYINIKLKENGDG